MPLAELRVREVAGDDHRAGERERVLIGYFESVARISLIGFRDRS
jgi:hypothetical protein